MVLALTFSALTLPWLSICCLDIFWDEEDGFNLDVHLRTEALPDWLVFDAVSGSFIGVPTNADVGYVPMRLVATDTGGLTVSVLCVCVCVYPALLSSRS